MNIPEYVLASILVLLGLRSLRYWMRRPFVPRTFGEHVLYVLHATTRVGIWFTLAAFFLGYALVDVNDPSSIGWFAMVPIALAAIQLLTSFYLSRSGEPPPEG